MKMKSEHFSIPSSQDALEIACRWDRPDNVLQPCPAIILAGGVATIMVEKGHLRPFVDAFIQQGYACITFDYRSFGQSQGKPRNLLNVSGQLQDARDVISWVRSKPDSFDPRKLVAWGSSFGGMHVTAIMASDFDIAAGIAQCPLVDGLRASLQIPVSRSLKLGLAGAQDVFNHILGKEPKYVAAASTGAKGSSLALMTSEEAYNGYHTVFPEDWTDYPNYVAARLALTLWTERPVRRVHKSKRPVLFIVSEWDHEASLPAAKKAARLAPMGELLSVKGGHFDVYEGGAGFSENLKGQLEFLKRVL